MQLILAVLVALLLVAGQTLWKIGLTAVTQQHEGNKLAALLTNVPLIIGVLVYGVATLLYMYVLSKYKYGTSYALIVSSSLIGATIVSVLYFNEKIPRTSYLGFLLIILGIVFVVVKK